MKIDDDYFFISIGKGLLRSLTMKVNRLLLEYSGYGGPIFIMLYFCLSTEQDMSLQAWVCALLWCSHCAKRVLEVAFVHIWSSNELPLDDAIGELVYYWGFSTWISYTVSRMNQDRVSWLAVATMLGCMVANGCAHWQLRQHRPLRTKTWPKGILFQRSSCPHYTFETGTWVSFAAVSGWQYSCIAFCVVGTLILSQWAKERHESYKKRFPDYPKERYALIPFVW